MWGGVHIRDAPAIDGMSVLQALADPVRVNIVRQLAACDGEMGCGALEVPVTKSTASHHIRTLVLAGVIGEREEGRRKFLWLRRSELEKQFPGLVGAVLQATV
jgi:DNA-binding transcriptional ArsR family regulator